MGRLTAAFDRARSENRAAIAPYFTVGFPDVEATLEGINAAMLGGADIIELGVPFSDPLADGATVQRSSTAALAEGVTLRTCLETARRVRSTFEDVPILFMGYYNPFYQYGMDMLAAEALAAGVDGLIVPDLPPEEAELLDASLSAHGLDLIYLIAPTSPVERITAISAKARGFIYCVSLTGVTGERDAISSNVPELIANVRSRSQLPLVLGFGISRPEHVAEVANDVDAVAVGSAMMNLMADTNPAEREATIRDYVKSLRGAASRTSDIGATQSARERP